MEDPTRGLLRHVAHGIAYRAVRNRGTHWRHLAHADPAADWLSTMWRSARRMPAEDPGGTRRRIADRATSCSGAFATALADDEVLVAVEIPRLSHGARWGYHKLCRKTGEFAKAIGAAVLDPAAACRASWPAPSKRRPGPAAGGVGGTGARWRRAGGARRPRAEAETRLAHRSPARARHCAAVGVRLARLLQLAAG